MAMTASASLKSGLAALLLCLGGPLRAQMNPSRQADNASATPPVLSTDFMDLYQQSSSIHVTPEIVTLLDLSTSEFRLMFHPSFPNNG